MKQIFALLLSAAGVPLLTAAHLDLKPAGNRNYFPGGRVNFIATAWDDDNNKLTQGTFTVTVQDSGGSRIDKPVTVDLSKNNPATISVTPTRPGFLLATASACKMPDGKVVRWSGKPFAPVGGAAVQPGNIRTGTERPADFDQFWQDGLKAWENAEVTVTPEPKIKRKGYKVSRIQVKFPDGSGAIDGFLSIPAKPGKYPATAGVPLAGPGAVGPTTVFRGSRPAIELWMNVHPFPTAATAAEQKKLYSAYNEALPSKRYFLHQADDRDQYIYRKVWLALSRAVNYVAALPEFDGRHFAMVGHSQGGGTALAVGGLNPHITCIVASVPGLCDHGGGKLKRMPGWPRLHHATQGKADAAMPYFDCVNFAPRIKVPVLVSVGYIDTVCPPASVYALCNALSCRKTIVPMPRHGHTITPEVRKKAVEFLDRELSK